MGRLLFGLGQGILEKHSSCLKGANTPTKENIQGVFHVSF